MGLASLARTIAQQRSRILHLKEGDVNTRYFHLEACHCSRKSFIDHLVNDGYTLVDEVSKANAIFRHFNAIFGVELPRSCGLTYEQLHFQPINLSGLDFCFSEDEIWSVICSMVADKVLGPDGFTSRFYTSVWPITKGDVVRAFHAFGQWTSVVCTW
jgi:hypothetical protein